MVGIILSSLALLAATTAAGLCLRERKRSQERNTALIQYISRSVDDLENRFERRLKDLENGVMPDYEKAREAAKAVNSFNDGITGILGFDPYTALQAQREKERGGENN